MNEVKTECFLYQNSITDKQKQQRIHDLEQMIEELTLQQECQRKQFEELYAQMEKKDAQILWQEEYIAELTETIEEQKREIRELQEKFTSLGFCKMQPMLSVNDMRSKMDSISMGPSALGAADQSGFARIRDDIKDIQKDFNALGFGQLL